MEGSQRSGPTLDIFFPHLRRAFFSRDILTMQQGTSVTSASISARYQSVTNSYRCNEYETQAPARSFLQPFRPYQSSVYYDVQRCVRSAKLNQSVYHSFSFVFGIPNSISRVMTWLNLIIEPSDGIKRNSWRLW